MTKLTAPDVCKLCGNRGAVIDSRMGNGYRRRRHKCECGHRWTTWQSRLSLSEALRRVRQHRPSVDS
jgi:transcriptional regulator NrdR family protein